MENEVVFKKLTIISERLSVKNTTKNVRLYFAYFFRCMRVSVRKYHDYEWKWCDKLNNKWAMPEGDDYGKNSRKKAPRIPERVEQFALF